MAMLDEDTVDVLVDMYKQHPEAMTALTFVGGAIWVLLDLVWLVIALPALVSAHDDSALLGAVFGSLGVVALNIAGFMMLARLEELLEDRFGRK